MFTGIIQDVGTVTGMLERGGDSRLTVSVQHLALRDVKPGDSICVNGVCLTALDITADRFSADVSRETLEVTTLGELAPGSRVNLEPALRAGDPLGGHLVSGHVDGIAMVTAMQADARSLRVTFRCAKELARYVAPKGSATLDGVSLTVNEVDGAEFGVNLIPHTQSVTTLGVLAVGRRVNLEVDQIARYVERLAATRE